MKRVGAIVALMLVPVGTQPAAAQVPSAWDAAIDEASARFGVPAVWIARVIEIESAGRTTVNGRPIRSRVGAMGLMQLMPATWRAMQRMHGLGSDPDDPRNNILAGTAYLRAMYDRFGYPGLFAAYNAGPARYAEHLAHRTRLPAETVTYLAKASGGGTVERSPAFARAGVLTGAGVSAVRSPGASPGDPASLQGGRNCPGVFFPLGNLPRR